MDCSLRLGALGILLCVAPTLADPGVVLEYDIRFGPLRLVEMHTSAVLGDGHYFARTDMRTVGVVGVLFPWTAEATSAGLYDAGRLQPRQHRQEALFRGQRRAVAIDYDEGGEVRAHIEPSPAEDERDAVQTELQRDTLDPLTASLAVLGSGCRGKLRVFDGRRRYDMRLSDLGESEVPRSRHHIYSGPARRCRADIEPVAGFWSSATRRDERPGHLELWIAAPRPNLQPVPVHLALTGERGTLNIHLTAVRPLSGATTHTRQKED